MHVKRLAIRKILFRRTLPGLLTVVTWRCSRCHAWMQLTSDSGTAKSNLSQRCRGLIFH